MAQHDYVIANGTGAAVRSDINNGLAAIVSNNSGATAPSTTYAYQWWADTTTGLLKLRNAANNGWITLFQLDGEWSTLAVENGSAAAPSIYFKDSGTDTGIYSPGTDQVAISTGGTGRLFVDSSGRVGLGISTPGYPLDLVSSGGESIRIRGTSGTEVGKLLFTSNSAGADYGWLSSASSYLAFGTASTERMRLTSTGLGIGTTTPSGKLSVVTTTDTPGNSFSSFTDSYLAVQTGTSAASSGLGFGYDSTNNHGLILSVSPSVAWRPIRYIAGDHRFEITGGFEKARIDSSGRLLVGTSTPLFSIQPSIQIARSIGGFFGLGNSDTVTTEGTQLAQIAFAGNQSGGYGFGAAITAVADGTWSSNSDCPSRLVFSTTADGASSPTERMRIGQAGRINHFSSTDGIVVGVSAAAGTATTIFVGRRSATSTGDGTDVFYVYSNGNVQNANNSYTGISDVKLKENIIDASSQWSDIKALKVRKYNFKEETGQETHTQIGLVAQEVEQISPGLVFETPDRDADGNETGEVTKGVNYSVLYMKAVKALQEAIERIETLEAKVAALEGA